MALFDDASLVVTPNGYKAGTLYSIKPTSGAGDMTVVRATTATRVNSAGLIESVANNVPRLDYLNASCPSLLVEPQRTNIVLYSEQFNNAAWVSLNVTVTANNAISPDGTQNADKIDYTNNDNYLITTATNAQTTSYTVSCYAKKGTTDIFLFREAYYFGSSAKFNLTNGTIVTDTTGTAKITSVGNGWYRCSITQAYTSIQTNVFWSCDSTLNTGSLYLWGAQIEAGSYPTSYIPTTSAAVTRNADVISKTGISSLIGQTEGTVFLDYIWNNNASDVVLMQVIGNNGKFFWFRENGVQFYGNGTTLLFDYSPGSATYGQRYKLAFVYGQNDFQLYRDGTLLSSITSGTFSGSFDDIILPPISSAPFDGSIKHNIITLFSTKLTNAECISLTTL